MMFRAIVRGIVPAAFAASFCLCAGAQTASPAKPATQAPTPSTATVGTSTSLDANPNALANIYGAPVEEIVARVNDRVITNSDLARAQSQLAAESRQDNWSLDQYNKHESSLLRDLIDQQLLLSKGKQLGITGDTELIKRLDEIRKQNHLASMDDLEKAVEQQGTSYEDFKANIRNSIVTQEVVRDEVGSKIQISQHAVQQYYDNHQADFTQPESVHLKEILIPTLPDTTSSQLAAAEAKAQDVWKQLKAGGDFGDLAKQYSGGPTAQQGGDLGDFKRGSLAKVLEDDTFSLPIGAYTTPIRTRQGYIILQVTAHNPGGTQPLQKVEPDIQQTLYMQDIEPAVRKYLTLLREQSYIDIRPGYTDSGASPNETKPTFEAAGPPPRKKKKPKARYVRGTVPRSRMSNRTMVASKTGANADEKRGKKQVAHKSKPVKFRFGHPPTASVAEAQVQTPPPATAPLTPAQQAIAAEASAPPGTGIQPLGPDLEHTPMLVQPKEGKRRFSDEARIRHEEKKREKRLKIHTVKTAKVNSATPSPLSQTELDNQKVQSAPLGLDGDTVHKKKKKKVHVKNGHKTRMSDEKKDEDRKNANPPANTTPPTSAGTAANPG